MSAWNFFFSRVRLVATSLVLMAVSTWVSAVDISEEATVEQQLTHSLEQFTNTLAASLPARNSDFDDLYTALLVDPARAEALSSEYTLLQAQHLLYLARFDSVTLTLTENQLGDIYHHRAKQVKERYLAEINPLLAVLDPMFHAISTKQASDIEAFRSKYGSVKVQTLLDPLVKKIHGEPLEILRGNTLPYRSLQLASRKPVISPAIVPTYLKSTLELATPADRQASQQVQLTDPILLKARELEHDPVRIYEFVHDSIKTEWYSGAMKGAEGTLQQRAGNAVDQASLLIALYRASSIPARYVTGVIEIPVEQIQNSLGLEYPQQAVIAMRRAGLAAESVVRGGKVAALQMEHTWVSVLVPYANYRGATVDKTGEAWLPLMPALKTMQHQNPTGIWSQMSLDAQAFRQEFISIVSTGDVLSSLRAKAAAYLTAQGEDANLETVLGSSLIVAEKAGYLPNSLPVQVVAVTAESAELPEAMIHKVRFVAKSNLSSTAEILLDVTLPLSQVQSQRVTLSYQAGSYEDQKLILSFGGLGNVPLYLADVRPQIKVKGLPVAIASDVISMGAPHIFEMELLAPQGTYSLQKSVYAGGYHAIGIAAQNVHFKSNELAHQNQDTETRAAEVLSQIALHYIDDWNRSETELAGMANRALVRPMPAVTFSGNDVDVQFVLGQAERFVWKGVNLDAAFRIVESFSRTAAASSEKDWLLLSGLQGSSLEHAIFERLYGVESVSADKGLALAVAQNIPIHTITSANASSQLPSLQHGNDVLADINRWLSLGYQVSIPETEITYLNWTGSVWMVQDLQTGTAGYFIARGLAGGVSAGEWPSDPGDDLADPYQGNNNKDPLAGASIYIIAGDGQTGKVAEEGKPLKVRVLDILGLPVVGAQVTFEGVIKDGDSGTFPEGNIVVTNASGIAEVAYTFPQKLDIDVTYRSTQGNQYPDKMGVVYITATASSSRSEVRIQNPYQLYVLPGDPHTITWMYGWDNFPWETDGGFGTWHVTDEYGNRVSNAEVTVSIPTITVPDDYSITKPFRVSDGDQSGSSVTVTSDFNGEFRHEVENGRVRNNEGGSLSELFYKVKAEAGDASKEHTFHAAGEVGFRFYGGARSAGRVSEEYEGKYGAEIVYIPSDKLQDVDVSLQPLGSAKAKGLQNVEFVDMVLGSLNEWYYGRLIWTYTNEKKETETKRFEIPGIFDITGVTITPDTPVVIKLDGNGVSEGEDHEIVSISYTSKPDRYLPYFAELMISKNGNPESVVTVVPSGSAGIGAAGKSLLPPMEFDPDADYTGEFIFNRGWKGYEVKSDPFEIKTIQPVIEWATVKSKSDIVDLLNDKYCADPDKEAGQLKFSLFQEAEVTVDVTDPYGRSTTIINGQTFEKGEHLEDLSQYVEGMYKYTITATSVRDGNVDTRENIFQIRYDLNYGLPVGHPIYEDVDLYNGSLSLSRTDASVPGVGPELEVRRSYSSLNTDDSPFGIGWSHNYDSSIHLTALHCGGWVTISGGDGGGIPFFPVGDGYKAGKGYHGSLERTADGWDFYSKDGTRYHYRSYSFDKPLTTWHLEYIQDVNGNVTSLGYNPKSSFAQLDVVQDSSGRTLKFLYGHLKSPSSYEYYSRRRALIKSVLGLDASGRDFTINYYYDPFGRLSHVEQTAGAENRHEYYEYWVPADGDMIDAQEPPLRVAMKRLVDYRGNETLYTFDTRRMFLASTPDAPLPIKEQPFVTAIKKRDLGNISFIYSSRESRSAPLETSYEDPKGQTYTYKLNTYGSPLSITGPAGTRHNSWKDDDVLMESNTDENGVTTSYGYDANGNVTRETVSGLADITSTYASGLMKGKIRNRLVTRKDRNGNTTRYEYDGKGNLISIVHPIGRESFSYDDMGNRLSSTDRNGNTTRYQYDKYGNVIQTTDALGGIQKATWDHRGRKLSETDANGNTTTFRYDGFDRLIESTNALGGKRQFSYDVNGNKLTETDEEGRITRWTYDNENRPVSMTTPDGKSRSMEYDNNGNLTRETDFRGNATTYVYDDANRQREVNQPLGRQIKRTFDGAGNILTETDALNHTTSYTYDNLNRRTSVKYADGGTETYVLDGNGNQSSIKDVRGNTTTQAFDGMNRRTERTEPLGRTLGWTYDPNGNVLTATDGNGGVTANKYDKLNRLLEVKDPEDHRRFFGYDAVGNLILEQDALLHHSNHVYDALNRRIQTTDPRGFVTFFEYDKVGNKTKETLPNSNVIVSTYDVRNRLTAQSDNLGSLLTHQYDNDGNIIRSTDANGNISTFEYDALSQKTDEHLPEGRNLQTTFDRVGNVLTQTDAKGGVTRFSYDERNRLLATTDALNHTAEMTYDKAGNKLSDKDRNNHVTRYEYDELNRLVSTTDPLNQVVSNSYDKNHNLLSTTDKRGILTANTYDLNNRLLSTTRAGVEILKNGYDEVGNLIVVQDARKNSIGYGYNEKNELIRESRLLAAITHYEVDAMGNRTKETDPEHRSTTYTYDPRNRLISTTNAANETVLYEYDGNGNQIKQTKPKGNAWSYTYDGANRLKTVIAPAPGGNTTYGYDLNNNLLSQTDALGHIKTFTYDALNQRLSLTSPAVSSGGVDANASGGVTTSWTYDNNGNPLTFTDANGTVTSSIYDALNRETSRSYSVGASLVGAPDIVSTTTIYDANNNVTSIADVYSGQAQDLPLQNNTLTETFKYDDFDRLINKTDSLNKTLKYGYDLNGNRTQLTDSDNKITTYTFDALNRVTQVNSQSGITTYSYDRSSLLLKAKYPNNSSEEKAYDAAKRTSNITNKQNSAVVSQYDYEYDDNGNRTQQIEINGGSAETTTYSFDNLDRLLSVVYPENTTTYTYDANYNRLTEKQTSQVDATVLVDKAFQYNERGQLTEIQDHLDAANRVTYQFDANGNQVQKVKGASATLSTSNFVYDARNNLRSVRTLSGVEGSVSGVPVSFLYDASGMRIEKIGERGTERYTYDDKAVLQQFGSDNQTIAKYEYGATKLISLKHNTEPTQFYFTDALNSVVNLTNSSGAVQARYQYDAWGLKRSESGSSWNRFAFTGYEEDKETNLLYAKARYYDPEVPRFLSQDAWEGQSDLPPSLHKYLYAYQNPTVWVDPTGNRNCGAKEAAYDCDEGTGLLNAKDANKNQVSKEKSEKADGYADSQGNSYKNESERNIADCKAAGGTNCAYQESQKPGQPVVNTENPKSPNNAKPSDDERREHVDQLMAGIKVGADATHLIDKYLLPHNAVEGTIYVFGGVIVKYVGGKLIRISEEAYKKSQADELAKKNLNLRVHNAGISDDEVAGFSQYDKYKNADGKWSYPKNNGFVYGTEETITLNKGYRLDRYGDEGGEFMAPQSTPFEQRSLPPGKRIEEYHQYIVEKPLPINSGKAAPAFGQEGGGMQFQVINPDTGKPASVEWLLDQGYIREIK